MADSSLGPSLSKVTRGFRLILEGLGLDPDDPHLQGTPHRAAKAWTTELFRGLTAAQPMVTAFDMDPGMEPQMVVFHDIPVKSMCSHHLLPIVGTASVGYIPSSQMRKIVGASKPSRIVNYYARRPQVQERLTEQVANTLYHILTHDGGESALSTAGVGVVVSANHFCMSHRGVGHDGNMVTSALRGSFEEDHVKQEFMALARENL